MHITLDATDQSMGRLSTKVATMLRGKHLATYQPHLMPGITVTVTNLDKVRFTGDKLKTRVYHRYSGYPGGLYSRTLGVAWARNKREVFRNAVKRMLPENRSRDKYLQNLKFK